MVADSAHPPGSDQRSETPEKQKEIIRQESFWFTATTLTFVGFVGAILKKPSCYEAVIAIALIGAIGGFTVFLLVGRHREYRRLNSETVSWWRALQLATAELSGTLYCVAVVTIASLGFALILWTRFVAETAPSTKALNHAPARLQRAPEVHREHAEPVRDAPHGSELIQRDPSLPKP